MIRIRPACADDAAALADLTSQLGYPVEATAMAGRLRAVLDRSDAAVLVAVAADDRPIGWLHIGSTATLQAPEHAVVHGLVVDAAHRGAGIGADLLAQAESWARDRGIADVVVRSRSTRERTHRFYLERGYRWVKRSEVFEKRLP